MKKILSERLRSLRLEMKLSQSELSKMAQIPQSTISEAENQERIPRVDTISKIATALNTTSSYLIGETNSSTDNK